MSDPDKPGAEPQPANLLSDPRFRDRFEQTSAALEAAHLVRHMRRQALSVSGVRGMTQDELAQRTGLTQPRISQIEKAQGRDGISYALLRRIAHACGIDWAGMINNALAAALPPEAPVNADQRAGTQPDLSPANTLAWPRPAELENIVSARRAAVPRDPGAVPAREVAGFSEPKNPPPNPADDHPDSEQT